jgi:hypothetical protein
MIGTLVGGLAKAAVTGAVGVAVINVLKDSKVGDTLRNVAVTVAEVGVRGYKLVEQTVEKVADTATDVYNEAVQRAEEPADATDSADAAATGSGETVATEAETFLRENGQDGKL